MLRPTTARLLGLAALALSVSLAGALPAQATDRPRVVEGGGYAHAGAVPGTVAPLATAAPTGYTVTGIDVSNHQGTIDWSAVKAGGAKFAYIKASEGVTYVDPYYLENLAGAHANGLWAGAYHYGRPDRSDGATQADHFLDSAQYVNDSRTMIPMLDIEYPWSGSGAPTPCYGLSTTEFVKWLTDFTVRVWQRTGQKTMIYTTASWFDMCTGSSTALSINPLFIAQWNGLNAPTTLPAGWTHWTLWQYSDSGSLPGDQDVYNGTATTMKELLGNPPTTKPRWMRGGGTPTIHRVPRYYRTPTAYADRPQASTPLRYTIAWY